jgi:hypothetical protein
MQIPQTYLSKFLLWVWDTASDLSWIIHIVGSLTSITIQILHCYQSQKKSLKLAEVSRPLEYSTAEYMYKFSVKRNLLEDN